MISPKEASTVPPGTPGAPMANNPNNRMNKVICKHSASCVFFSPLFLPTFVASL